MRSILLTTGACSITVDDVRRLLTFDHIHRLELRNTGLVPDDHLLDDMAKAWPMLEKLHITNVGRRIPCKATLSGLVPFSKHCPHIANLQLQLDAREVSVPTNTTDASRDECREWERTVVLTIEQPSKINDSTGVALFLLNLFPRIMLFIPYEYAELQQDFLWRRVVKIIDGTELTLAPTNS
ncbi:hypothetical protein PAXINDRAFT_14907 [Paxillus involutus ATCC 200175]|uniref:Uncharacterized protein n=1 Tax=Paxillus involutus ATCC 200175 TaxID=664439 RepID=A0A0C9STS5_PAXIN|nr:hypothetical protein PAXINDRAFT_14907 [Paxillus involutus ATCC 200175]